jgi:hypothetical protein
MSGRHNMWRTPSTSWITGKTRCQGPMQFWRILILLCVSLKLISWHERGEPSGYLNYVSQLVWKTDMVDSLSNESFHGLMGRNLACELQCMGVMCIVHARCKKPYALYATCVFSFSYVRIICIPCEINTYISQHHYMGFMCLPIHIYRVYGSVCLQIFCMAVHTVMILAPGLYDSTCFAFFWLYPQ